MPSLKQSFGLGRMFSCCHVLLLLFSLFCRSVQAEDLEQVKARGVLRHLGVPYANFITGSGDGMDVELMQLFAAHLGVKYQYVPSTWADVIGDLTGKQFTVRCDSVKITGDVPVKGDIIANGFTVLAWRQQLVDYSQPTFLTQIWAIVRSDSPINPIQPGGDLTKDIASVKALLKGSDVLGKAGTCLDPSLYALAEAGMKPIQFDGALNELAPAVVVGKAEATILDVPDALIAMEKWPGKLKILGPLSAVQDMGCAFAKTTPHLRDAFNQFLEQCKKDGTYLGLVKKYYPDVFRYYPEFFKGMKSAG